MKRTSLILLIIFAVLSGCTKTEPTRTSGTDKIDNITYQSTTYYVYGFSFSQAKLVPTTATPGPDIIIYVDQTTPPARLTLQSDNFKPSFYKAGDFADAASAASAFDNLKTVSVSQWEDIADPIEVNQVWIYRTGTDCYAKFMIVSTVNETRQSVAYGECSFRWVYQPDGSSTFPGK
jgi:PBP1b-binding outer membrane lipoprotein LpoB